MAYTINRNYSDTPTGKAAPTITVVGLNFGADFRIDSDKKGQTDIVNITSPLGCEETWRFASTSVKDIYAGTKAARDMRYPSSRGVALLCQVNDIWTAVNGDDPKDIVALPVSAHLVVKVPANPLVSASDVKDLIGRMLGGLFETGSSGTDRIEALLRQSTKPKEL